MFGLLVEKELKNIVLSPKFVATFGVCSLLILLSVFVGIQEYKASVAQYEVAQQLTEQQVREATNWWGVNNTAYRAPDPLMIFASGVNYDVGRLSNISTWTEVKLEQSTYMNDTIFAIFRFIDFAFIVQVVLSLFAILFTYDAINGERESGTLKLTFANAVPRGQYVLSKFVGSWLGLTIPLLIPILIAVLLVMVMGVPMEGVHWSRLGAFIGVSVLYFTFFIAFGLLVSALTKRSSVSFLVLLVAWVILVLIVPRAATMAAGQLVPVPSVAEIESQKDRFRTDRWDQHREEMSDFWEARQPPEGLSEEEQRAYRQERMDQWMQEMDELRQVVQADIAENERKVNEDLRNKKAVQEELAFTLSRLSPASAYQLAVMNLAGTNTAMKSRYEDSMQAYKTIFTDFVEDKRAEEQAEQRRQARNNSGGGVRIRFSGSNDEPIDVSEMPRYEAPEQSLSNALAPSIIDFGLLAFFSIAAFAGAFLAFVRYDVR